MSQVDTIVLARRVVTMAGADAEAIAIAGGSVQERGKICLRTAVKMDLSLLVLADVIDGVRTRH